MKLTRDPSSVHRPILTLLGIALGAGLLAGCGPSEPTPPPLRPPTERPHMVLFLADDLGWNDVGYHGSEIRTPTIDRLRDEGLELDTFYVQHMCTPTRAALLTGRYPMRYGLQTGVLRPWSDDGLDLQETLLPERLRAAGYATHLVGKWHLGFAQRGRLPTERGFDHHYGLYTGRADYRTRLREGALDWHRDGEPLREEGYSTHLLRDEARRIIERHDPALPLFLFLSFSAPHFPLQAPAEEIEAYAGTIDDADRRTYAAMVTCLDEAMGDVLAALEERGMREDTLVLFLSDNGASPEHGGSNLPLPGGKNTLAEGGLRVPALVAWPGVLPRRVIDTPLHVVDLAPTLLALAGLPADQEPPFDGLDLRRHLFDGRPLRRDHLLLSMSPARGALRAGPWKLVVDYVRQANRDAGADPQLGLELYDLASDPTESRNQIHDRSDVYDELRPTLQTYYNRMIPRRETGRDTPPKGFVVPAAWGPRD